MNHDCGDGAGIANSPQESHAMDTGPIYDLATLLPPQARRHYTILNDAVADDAAISRGFSARMLEMFEDCQAAQRRKGEIRSVHSAITDDHDAMREQDQIIAKSAADRARLDARIAMHTSVAGPRARLLRDVQNWIRETTAGLDIVDAELPAAPKLGKGETPAAAVERLRRRLRELDADAHRVNSAPFPSGFAKQVAANHIAELASAAASRMSVSSLVEHGGPLVIDGQAEPPVVWPITEVRSKVATVAGEGAAIGYIPDIIGIMALLFPDQMRKRVEELVEAEYDSGMRETALSWEQRREQLATIASDRAHVEREEGYWLWQSFAAGVVVEPRGDMTPSAFLMVTTTAKADRPAPFDHAEAIARGQKARSKGQPIKPDAVRLEGQA